jgi:hypothetical protein
MSAYAYAITDLETGLLSSGSPYTHGLANNLVA